MTFPWIVGLGLVLLAGLGCFAVVVVVQAAWRRRQASLAGLALALAVAGGAQLAQLNAGEGPVVSGGISVVTLLAATVAFLLVALLVSRRPGSGRRGSRAVGAERSAGAAPGEPAPSPGPPA